MVNPCLRCSHKQCKDAQEGVLDICDYGVAYYKNGDEILKREEKVTLRQVSQNLRHELHKILQMIVSDASQIDNAVSVKEININSPASRIVGATVIIDQFIEMISGVNDFHPSRHYSTNLNKKVSIRHILEKYSQIYSLIQNTRRAKNLNIDIMCDEKINVSFGGNIVEYIVSVLFDNLWKYSLSDTQPKVCVHENEIGLLNIEFSNTSPVIEKPDTIFEKGYQEDASSEGFGYGLFWIIILIEHYNEISKIQDNFLELTHHQTSINSDIAEQKFILKNIRI